MKKLEQYRPIIQFIANVVQRRSTALSLAALASFAVSTSLNAESLPDLGTAPQIELTTLEAADFSMQDLHGKVAVVNFVFTRCGDRCPLLITKLLMARQELGEQFARDVHFVSVTIDAEYDNPKVLKEWAAAFGADTDGWSFLTGNPVQVYGVVKKYGVLRLKHDGPDIDHNLLTSIVDRDGNMRVQYIGDRFDTNEFVADIRSLIN